MRRLATRLEGPLLIEPVVHGDARGFFLETYRAHGLAELGVHDEFVQDNHSRSRARACCAACTSSPARPSSCAARAARSSTWSWTSGPARPSFGRWEAVPLDDEAHHQLYVPDGFAHGFCVLSEVADVIYKVSTYYDPASESGFRFDDPEVGIELAGGARAGGVGPRPRGAAAERAQPRRLSSPRARSDALEHQRVERGPVGQHARRPRGPTTAIVSSIGSAARPATSATASSAPSR